MPRELRRGSGEILRKTKLRDVRTLSVLNKFIIGMSDCKEKNAKKPHKAACNIKCERTNTTSNDGYAFYRIYFFTINRAKTQ